MVESGLTFYPSETHSMPLALITRDRLLPVAGQVLVRQGEHVDPTQVVARAQQARDLRILDVARLLAVEPSQVERYLRKKVGDSVAAGEPVAVRSGMLGLGRRIVRAPADSTLLAVGGGRVLLEMAPEEIQVRAYLAGTVAQVIPELGVRVETAGAWLQAAWGYGGEAFGVLRVVGRKPEDPLRAKAIDVSCHGAIVVSGGWIDPGAFAQAQQLQVRGIIAGSMDGDQRATAERCGFPVILTEGLGRMLMGAPMYQLLHSQNGREACISGTPQTRFGTTRPEVIVPLPVESRPSFPPPPGAPLSIGMCVRVLRPPYMGAIGTVTALPAQARRLDSGIQLHGAEVNLGAAGIVFVPYMNLELLR